MNKRGSHIGVIISFIIFIGMIVFLYSILSPKIQVGQDNQAIMDSLALNLKNALSGNLTSISVYANYSSSGCLNFSEFVSNANLNSPLRATAQNKEGIIEDSGVSGDEFYINKTDNSQFFIIHDSANLSQSPSGNPSGCTLLKYGSGEGNYTIGQVKTSRYLFESAISNMISDYGNGYNAKYSSLKSSLGVSPQRNFGFNLIYQNGTSIGTDDNTISSVNVYSQYFPVTYVTVNGSVQSGSLVIRVW